MKSIGFYKDQVWPHAYLTAQRAAAVKEAPLSLEESLLSLGDTSKTTDLFCTVKFTLFKFKEQPKCAQHSAELQRKSSLAALKCSQLLMELCICPQAQCRCHWSPADPFPWQRAVPCRSSSSSRRPVSKAVASAQFCVRAVPSALCHAWLFQGPCHAQTSLPLPVHIILYAALWGCNSITVYTWWERGRSLKRGIVWLGCWCWLPLHFTPML